MLIYWRIFFLFILSLFFQISLFATTDRYRCMWQDDPATTMVIGWDQQSGHSARVYYDVSDWRRDYSSYNFVQEVDRSVRAKGMNNNFVRLTNLYPNTVYYFVIKDNEGVSKRMSFKTAPDNNSIPLSIIAGGDSRNHRTARSNANKTVAKLRAHCVMFGGDMTGGDNDKGWQGWMDDWQYTIAKDGRLTPIIPARGNHEESNQSIIDLFDVRNEDIIYGLTLGGDMLRIMTLNSLMSAGGDQKTWLENDLKYNSHVKWKFAQYHYSIRPHTLRKSERNGQMKHWAPLFYEHGVDLVCESDAHMVKTTYPIRPSTEAGSEEGFIRDDQGGTVYVGEGCWGAPLRRNNDDKAWTRASGSFNQFKWIFVYYDRVEVRTIKTDDAEYVRSVNPDDIFYPPKGLKVWNPPSGDVLTIYQNDNLVASKYPIPSQPIQQRTSSKESDHFSTKERQKMPPTILSAGRKNRKTKRNKPKVSPTSISGFKAMLDKDEVMLNWKTKFENRAPIFELQRAVNGNSYQTYAHIQGQGKIAYQAENSYQFKDNKLSNVREVSYRIKHTLPDGSVIMSHSELLKPVKKLDPEWAKFPKIKTDPRTGQLSFRYRLDKPTNVSIRLLNDDNSEIFQRDFRNVKSGNFIQSIDVSRMSIGNYLLIIESERMVLSKYIVEKKI